MKEQEKTVSLTENMNKLVYDKFIQGSFKNINDKLTVGKAVTYAQKDNLENKKESLKEKRARLPENIDEILQEINAALKPGEERFTIENVELETVVLETVYDDEESDKLNDFEEKETLKQEMLEQLDTTRRQTEEKVDEYIKSKNESENSDDHDRLENDSNKNVSSNENETMTIEKAYENVFHKNANEISQAVFENALEYIRIYNLKMDQERKDFKNKKDDKIVAENIAAENINETSSEKVISENSSSEKESLNKDQTIMTREEYENVFMCKNMTEISKESFERALEYMKEHNLELNKEIDNFNALRNRNFFISMLFLGKTDIADIALSNGYIPKNSILLDISPLAALLEGNMLNGKHSFEDIKPLIDKIIKPGDFMDNKTGLNILWNIVFSAVQPKSNIQFLIETLKFIIENRSRYFEDSDMYISKEQVMKYLNYYKSFNYLKKFQIDKMNRLIEFLGDKKCSIGSLWIFISEEENSDDIVYVMDVFDGLSENMWKNDENTISPYETFLLDAEDNPTKESYKSAIMRELIIKEVKIPGSALNRMLPFIEKVPEHAYKNAEENENDDSLRFEDFFDVNI